MSRDFIVCKLTRGSGILAFLLIGALKGITVENARWMGSMLGRLSEKQLGDAFRAAGFDDSEVATYVRAMHERIGELQNLK